jgi:hypothetical protein
VFKEHTFYHDFPSLSQVGGAGVIVKKCYLCCVTSSLTIEDSVDVNVKEFFENSALS